MRQPTTEELVNSKVLNGAFDKIHSNLADRFFTAELDNTGDLRSLRYMAHAVSEVKRFLRAELQAEVIDNEHRDT